MPEWPISLAISQDRRCNLACPSCRKEHVYTVDESTERDLQRLEDLIERHRDTLEVLKVGLDGEVFFSPWLKSLLKRLHPERYPKFRHLFILSNGLLFDEKMYQSLLPGSSYIQQVSISVDAGNAATYQCVRGGNWERLLKNLAWLGELRKKELLRYFQINFTVQVSNFESIPDFVELAKQVNASNAKFTALVEFPGMALSSLSEHAVHHPSHPRHAELREIWEKIRGEKIVRWSLPLPAEASRAAESTAL